MSLLATGMAALALAAGAGSFDSAGVPIHYVSEGEGETVVLLHGWMSDSTMWGRDAFGNAKLRPLPGFRLVAMDARGHGKSGMPHSVEAYGAEMAADVVRLLDHLEVKRAHFVGYSMGVFLAAKVAAMRPERVLSIVYGGQAPLRVGEGSSRQTDAFFEAVESGQGLGPYLLQFGFPNRPKPAPEAAEALAKVVYAGKDVRAWAAAGRSFEGLTVRAEDLVKCKAPSLFLFGALESDQLKARVRYWQSLLPEAEVQMIEGGDHVTTLAKAEFRSGLVAFLTKHRGRS